MSKSALINNNKLSLNAAQKSSAAQGPEGPVLAGSGVLQGHLPCVKPDFIFK